MSWEISIIEIEENGNKLYKVTRRNSEYYLSETKIFDSKEKAKEQFNQWLDH
ncbi:hypothetical protein ACFL1H_00495 [Nanoarchaeota archaeon]